QLPLHRSPEAFAPYLYPKPTRPAGVRTRRASHRHPRASASCYPRPKHHIRDDYYVQQACRHRRWGEDYDYSGYEWFKDPPPRPEVCLSCRASLRVSYARPGGHASNAMFDFALKSAPNVLYSKYKQYGQLGVLAWSSEFSEMIDALKGLGFEGNMFVATRTQALRTCEEIVKLLKRTSRSTCRSSSSTYATRSSASAGSSTATTSGTTTPRRRSPLTLIS
ncbi:uncharacterized protein B0H18DRAFT_1151129, partial [Fomitopsis serialis]|uniref:uncharacterized protein n=1 Tax=Fomitopsis serialis TaxID=139415 RepID=UPI00200833A2